MCGYIVQSFFLIIVSRAWLKLISKVDNWNNSIACIGETTGSAAKKLGLKSIYYPTTPGLEGYAHIILPFE
jgi:uroporphyrinogen-III synthase